jgi:WD40 repeat protein
MVEPTFLQVFTRLVLLIPVSAVPAVASALAGPPIAVEALQRTDAVSFEQEILPLLRKNCLACHSAGERQGGLILETPAAILKGGDSGPAAIPGNGMASLMLKLAAHQQEPVMPPEGNDVAALNLTPAQLGLLRLWIDQGARGTGGIDHLSPRSMQPVASRLQSVQAVAVTADGQYLAFGRGNRIYLHHVPTGQLVTTLADAAAGAAEDAASAFAHRDIVQSLAFNTDGDLLASGGFREVKLWRRPKDVRRATIPLTAAPAALAVSSDRSWLAVGSADHSIRLFQLPAGAAGPVLQGHTGPVTGLRFASGLPHLLSASADQTVRVWELPDGRAVGRIETPAPLTALEIFEPGTATGSGSAAPAASAPTAPSVLVTAGGDNLLRLWQLPGSLPVPAAEFPAGVRTAAFTADRRFAAAADGSGNLTLLELSAGGGSFRPRVLATWKTAGVPTALAIGPAPGVPVARPENPAAALQIFAGFENGLLQLRQLTIPELVKEWTAGPSAITAVDQSVDGKVAASASADGRVIVWNIASPASAQPAFEAVDEEDLRTAQLSPSRRLLVSTAQQDGQPVLVIRSTETGKITHRLAGHTGPITAFAVSADDGRLISAGGDGTLRFWDLRNSGQPELKKIEALPGAVTAVGCTTDGAQAVAAFTDNIIRSWNAADGMLVQEFSGHTAEVLHLDFHGGQLCSVSRDGSVRFWNPADGTQVRVFSLPAAPSAVAFTPDGQKLLAASENRCSLHQLDNGNVLLSQDGIPGAASAVSISADARVFSLLLPGGQYQVRELSTGNLQEASTDPQVAVAAFALPATGLLFARNGGLPEFRGLHYSAAPAGNPTSPVRGLVFHPNNQLLVYSHADGTLRGINPAGAAVAFNSSHGAAVNQLVMSADGQLFATAGENAVLKIWNTSGQPAGPRELSGFPGGIRSAAFSADGKLLLAAASRAAADPSPVVRLYELATGALLQQTTAVGNEVPLAAVFSPVMSAVPAGNGNSLTGPRTRPPEVLLVSAAAAQVWQADYLGNLAGHTGIVQALAQLPGAAPQLISGGTDNSVRIWNVSTGQTVRQVNHGATVFSVAAASDGQRFATAGDNRTTRIWNVNGNQIAELRGDIRRATALTRARQAETAANARVTVARQQLEAAEKDLPIRTEAEKKSSAALAAAAADLQTKQTAVDTTLAAKTQSEKVAIEASAASRVALSEKQAAELAAKDAAAAVQSLQARMTRLQQAAAADPASETLRQKVTAARSELEMATRRSTELTAAVQAPTAKASEMAGKANEAAQKLESVQKPYNDAVAALKSSVAAHKLAAQQQTLAAAELKTAQDLIPSRRESLALTEAILTEAKHAVQAADELLKQADQPLRTVDFSPDSTRLLTAGDFSSLHTWDAAAGTAIDAFAGHKASVRAALYVDERTIVSISDDNSMVLWDSRPGWELARIIGAADQPDLIAHRVTSVEFSADSTRLLAAGGIPSRRGELQVFSVPDGTRQLHLPQAHDDVIYAARFSPDGRRIAAASADKYIRTFDASTGEMLRRFEGHTSHVLGVSWKRDGQTLVSAGADNSIKVWTAETADQQRTISNFGRPVTAVNYVGDTDQIICVSGDRAVRLYNAANGGQVRNFAGADSWQHAVAATPDNAVVAAGGASGAVRVWNGSNGQLLRDLK